MADNGLLLYNHPVSSNALKARYMLSILGLDYETSHVPFAWPRPDHYTKLNPFGRIPTLVDGDLVLAESNAILRYLADREGREDLYPRAPKERARVDRAMDSWSTVVRPALFPGENLGLIQTGDWDAGGGKWEDAEDKDALTAAVDKARGVLANWEKLIADNGTVTGSFSIADCCAGPVLWRWQRLPLDFSELPRTQGLQQAVANSAEFAAAEPAG